MDWMSGRRAIRREKISLSIFFLLKFRYFVWYFVVVTPQLLIFLFFFKKNVFIIIREKEYAPKLFKNI